MVDQLYRVSGWLLSLSLFGISAIAVILGSWQFFVLYVASAVVICPRVSIPLGVRIIVAVSVLLLL